MSKKKPKVQELWVAWQVFEDDMAFVGSEKACRAAAATWYEDAAGENTVYIGKVTPVQALPAVKDVSLVWEDIS